MKLQSALDQIEQIHQQMSLTRTFRGYRAATTFFTALLAVAAAVFQNWWLPDPVKYPQHFVDLWVSVAIISLVVVGTELVQRFRRTDSPLQRQLTIQAVEQFLPSIVIGGLVTALICQFSHECIWLLPGLWEIFFGMGILASRPLLPRPIFYVGAFYLLCGAICIGQYHFAAAFSPWSVALPFAIGQTGLAFVLHRSLESDHES